MRCADGRTEEDEDSSDGARAGVGVAVLPCFVAEPDVGLRRLTPVIPDLRTNLWILTHRDTRRSARVRAFMDFMASRIKAKSAILACEPEVKALP